MEAVIKEIAGVSTAEVHGKSMFAIFAIVESGDAIGKCRVLAQSDDRWKVGAKVVIEQRNGEYEGPDGEKDWQYCGFDKPESERGNSGGGGGGFQKAQTSGFTAAVKGADTGTGYGKARDISFVDASQAYDEILAACGNDGDKTAALFEQYMKGQKIATLPLKINPTVADDGSESLGDGNFFDGFDS